MIFPMDLMLTGSEFYRIGATTEKALLPTFVLTPETTSRLERGDRTVWAVRSGGCLD